MLALVMDVDPEVVEKNAAAEGWEDGHDEGYGAGYDEGHEDAKEHVQITANETATAYQGCDDDAEKLELLVAFLEDIQEWADE